MSRMPATLMSPPSPLPPGSAGPELTRADAVCARSLAPASAGDVEAAWLRWTLAAASL